MKNKLAKERMEELEAKLNHRDAENADLTARLEKLEALLKQELNGGVK